MWEKNKDILTKFLKIHDLYKSNRKQYASVFNQEGKEVRQVMEEWDRRLCAQMERGKNGVFSSKVSEKFWEEIRKDFPLIEFVGVEFL